MRESFILIILTLVIAVKCYTSESDTYNLYKDQITSADSLKINPVMRKLLNTYSLRDEYNMATWLPEYIKRASDINKKFMQRKSKKLDERVEKRTSKAALSLMLQSKQTPEHTEEEHSCYFGK